MNVRSGWIVFPVLHRLSAPLLQATSSADCTKQHRFTAFRVREDSRALDRLDADAAVAELIADGHAGTLPRKRITMSATTRQ
ncbi:hypothetical protein UNPA324_20980 [Bradyrhizobium sp. UNPA324]|nr:hypothetical protein UNPA324_20980 [Bradyrhizobium sp. UNPA324]